MMNFSCVLGGVCAVVVALLSPNSASPIAAVPVPDTRPEYADPVQGVENVAKLLIELDQGIEKAFESSLAPWDQLYVAQAEVDPASSNSSSPADREEKFSVVLQDLTKIEDQIKDAIGKANTARHYRLVLRLRPLLSYVTNVHRNMEMLRTRVVAIATLSNLAVTVTEVLDQFGDVMTSSMGLAGGIVPPNKEKQPEKQQLQQQQTSEPRPQQVHKGNEPVAAAIPVQEAPTTLSYTELDAENFLKKIINQEVKK